MTQRQLILNTLRTEPNRWFRSYELNQANTPLGWIGSAGSRRCRELAQEGKIEVRHKDGFAEYKHKPTLADRVIARANDYQPRQLNLIG